MIQEKEEATIQVIGRYLLAILLPPVAIATLHGFGEKFWRSCLLVLCLIIPSMVYAVLETNRYYERLYGPQEDEVEGTTLEIVVNQPPTQYASESPAPEIKPLPMPMPTPTPTYKLTDIFQTPLAMHSSPSVGKGGSPGDNPVWFSPITLSPDPRAISPSPNTPGGMV